jgi:histone deacetylase 1/2
MENANSKEYLEKIKVQVIENLKKTAHAPSVQMTDVPRTDMLGALDNDDYEAELDDLDDDENKDVRTTKRRLDQRITRDDEFDESDDEEEQTNGVQRAKRSRNIMDYQNSHAVTSDVDMDSGIATPEARHDVDEIVTALAIEANAEVNAEVMEQKSRSLTVADVGEIGTSNAPSRSHSQKPTIDHEGDVDMEERPLDSTDPLSEVPLSPAVTAPTSAPAPEAALAGQGAVVPEIKKEWTTEAVDVDVKSEVTTENAQQP